MSRLFPLALARMVLRPDERIEETVWTETQVTARQRRADRVLIIRLAGSGYLLLHIEWTMRLTASVRERAAEYHFMLAKSARRDLKRKRGGKETKELIAVESVIVVLTGRKKPWPRFGRYKTSPAGKRFTGVIFRIEAVYQRTISELEAKGSHFWLAFVPLAIDATQEKIIRIIEKLRMEATNEEFVEIIATMLSMAQIKKDWPDLTNVIRSAARKEVTVRHPWYCDGREDGLAEGRHEGREKGREEGREEGRHEGLAPLLFQFERRLGRSLTVGERRRIANRLLKDGPEKLGSVVIDLSRKKLALWLEPRRSASKSRAA
jgi:predicted transposase YdaD